MTSLTAEQQEAWTRNGYLILPGLLADRATDLDSEAARVAGLDNLIDTMNLRCRWADHVDTGECRIDAFDPIIDLSEALARVARDDRLLGVLEELYGEPARLFKDKLILKPSGAPGYDLHQDYIAWEEFPETFVTAIVAIDASSRDTGGTEFFAGEHLRGVLSAPDGGFNRLKLDDLNVKEGIIPDLEPGDVVLFGGLVPHRSAPNRSERSRRMLYLSYNADSDGGDHRDSHYRQFHAWLRERYAEHGKIGTFFR